MRVLLAILLAAATCFAQDFTQRGFLENLGTLYPQDAKNDHTNTIGESLFRYEGFYKPRAALQVAGAIDLRIDTHQQVNRDLKLSWSDRELQRPLAEVRRLSACCSARRGDSFARPWGADHGSPFIRARKT